MELLYLTADLIAARTGGGAVTADEVAALSGLGGVDVLSRTELGDDHPWGPDRKSLEILRSLPDYRPRLTHVYSGTFSKSVELLKSRGSKVSYTAAAHSVEASKREHELGGQIYDYPHLTDPVLWADYLRGYLLADRVVVPSEHSRQCMLSYGVSPDRLVRVPHGVDVPSDVRETPRRFTVGYLGALGPDKGVRYLLQAWKKLNYSDAVLRLAGAQTASDYARSLVRREGGGQVELVGWVDDVGDFYDSLSVYVQPSVTEGFGLEVLESMARGRITLCSTGAGACDAVPSHWRFSARDVDALVALVGRVRTEDWLSSHRGAGEEYVKGVAREHSRDRVRLLYQNVWEELLGESL